MHRQPTHRDHSFLPLLPSPDTVGVDEVPHQGDASAPALGFWDVSRPPVVIQHEDGCLRRGRQNSTATHNTSESHLEPIAVLPEVLVVHDGDVDDCGILVSREAHLVGLCLKILTGLCSAPTFLDDELHFHFGAGLRTRRASANRNRNPLRVLKAWQGVVGQIDVVLYWWRLRWRGFRPSPRGECPFLNTGPEVWALLTLVCPLPEALPKAFGERTFDLQRITHSHTRKRAQTFGER
mmetsp:Transcript_90317/g.227289  ORF Transcript_90317/g.227289 Transcript_90317/m.227289 type:complete len:237 (-) Transcript_90317:145-855(-)